MHLGSVCEFIKHYSNNRCSSRYTKRALKTDDSSVSILKTAVVIVGDPAFRLKGYTALTELAYPHTMQTEVTKQVPQS